MVKKSEERKDIHKEDINTEKKDSFKTCEDSYTAVSKMWEDSYLKLYKPWFESTEALFGKAFELSKDAAPETYKEFHTLWMNTFQELYGRLFDTQSMRPSKEILEYFERSGSVNLNLYKSWTATLGKMYGKAFDNFFENTPTFSPFKEIMEPVKNAAKIYTDTFSNMSNIWVTSYHTSKDTV